MGPMETSSAAQTVGMSITRIDRAFLDRSSTLLRRTYAPVALRDNDHNTGMSSIQYASLGKASHYVLWNRSSTKLSYLPPY